MNKIILFTLAVLLLANTAFAQVTFEKTNGPYGGVRKIVIDGQDNLYLSTSDGLYISTNDGGSWQNIAPEILDAKINVNKQGVVLAVSGSTIFLSKDKGKNWVNKKHVIPEVQSVALDARNNIFIGTNDGLYTSNDEGNTLRKFQLTNKQVNSIVVDSKDKIYVATAEGVFCSSDGGKTFSSIGLTDKYITAMAVNPNGDIFVLSEDALFCFTLKDKKWNNISELDGYEFGISLDQGGQIYITYGYETGLFVNVLNNKGESLEGLEDIKGTEFVFNSKGQTLSWDDHNIYKSTGSGKNWVICNKGINSGSIQDIKISPNGDYYVAMADNLSRSTNKGADWTLLPIEIDKFWTAGMNMSLNSKGHIYILSYTMPEGAWYGGYTLSMSSDNGNTWKETGTGDSKYEIVYMGIDYGDNVYLGSSNDKKIYRLIPNGKKLTFFCNLPKGVDWYNKILFNKKNDIYIVFRDAVYYSSDQGKKWTKLSLMPTIKDVFITQTGDIFALITNSASESSVYLSKDSGKNWERFLDIEKGLPASCFTFDEAGYMILGTSGRGLWKSTQTVLK